MLAERNKSAFSLLRRLTTWHHRHLLGPILGQTDGQTDARQMHSLCSAAHYAGSAVQQDKKAAVQN